MGLEGDGAGGGSGQGGGDLSGTFECWPLCGRNANEHEFYPSDWLQRKKRGRGSVVIAPREWRIDRGPHT